MSRRYVPADVLGSPDRELSEMRDSFELSVDDSESQTLFPSSSAYGRHISLLEQFRSINRRILNGLCFGLRFSKKCHRSNQMFCRPSRPRRLFLLFQGLLIIAILLATFTAVFRPSYSNPPARYHDLRLRAKSGSKPGRVNTGNEKIFIAASIFDPGGHLAQGAWGKNLLGLIDLLGPANVFLSIYENDAGPIAKRSLEKLGKDITSEHQLIFEDQLDLNGLPRIQLPDGTKRIKRIAYLAEVRNRALRPLNSSNIKFDKLLYLNDVFFDPVSAAQLLFATNARSNEAQYRAACALDFINPFKFYDTLASRDLEGYSMGLPIYPWFSSAGKAQSRQDVLDQKDAVRVKGCWGGMVAFNAKFFQSAGDKFDEVVAGNTSAADFTGFRFRSEQEMFWESSECCLIHADIQNPVPGDDPGIYMNPFVRVAYDASTLSWLGLSRRIERIYTPFQYIINTAVGLPRYNPRRTEQAGETVQQKMWLPDMSLSAGGSFMLVDRIASHDGFCGQRILEALKEGDRQPGEKNWEFIQVPSR